jgi:glutamate dehydrogenase/leucine dehydrogenase
MPNNYKNNYKNNNYKKTKCQISKSIHSAKMTDSKTNGVATNGTTNGNTIETKFNGVGPDGIAPPKSSGIKVIIVGLGYAGCVAAVECHRKGHEVVVYEQAPQITNIGTSLILTT